MRKYPFIKQEGLKDCGAACLAMIIKYYDGYVSLDKLRVLTKTNREGVNAYDLCEGAKDVGFEAYGLKCDLDSIKEGKVVLPCIAHVKINNILHYIVVYEINIRTGILLIADPADKVKKITFSDFENIWNGVLLNLYPTRKILLEKETKFIHDILEIIKPYSQLLINISLLSLIAIAVSCLSSLYFKTLVDNLNTSKNYLLLIFIIFLVINIVKLLNSFFRNKLFIYFNQKLDMKLSIDIYQKIIELPYQYYRNRTTGEIVSRFNDLNLVKEVIEKILLGLFVDLPLMIVSLILLFLIDIRLGFISFLILFIYALSILIFKPFLDKFVKKIQYSKDITNSLVVESVSGFETVKNLNKMNYFKTAFAEKYYNLLNINFNLDSIVNIKVFLNELILEVGTILVLFIGANKIFDGEITIGTLILFYSVFNYFSDSCKGLLNLDIGYKEAKNSLKRISEMLIDTSKKGVVKFLAIPRIYYHHLSYGYNDKSLVLDNINLKIDYGEKVLITGSSGSGKSTLLKLLMKYYDIDNNQIFIDNIDINYYMEEVVKKHIVYISQDEILFSDSIINNLCLGDDLNAGEVVRLCEIDSILNKRNLNLNYVIEENGFNFSGGEKQRLILGRALLKQFKVLLIDEGLNQMDVNLERRILKRMFDKYKNETIIVVSHRMANSDLYDRTIKLFQGRVIKDVYKNK